MTRHGQRYGTTLTKRQEAIRDYIVAYMAKHDGRSPTVREICKHFHISSPNGVFGHMKALVKKGVITRDRKTSRGIHLTDPLEVLIRQIKSLPLHLLDELKERMP